VNTRFVRLAGQGLWRAARAAWDAGSDWLPEGFSHGTSEWCLWAKPAPLFC